MYLAAFTAAQITSISDALQGAVSDVLDTFISLLPIIAVIVGAMFGIRFIKGRFGQISHTK